MKQVKYTGTATVREISAHDIKYRWELDGEGIRIDTRVSRLAVVSEAVANQLAKTGEFEIQPGDIQDEPPAPEQPQPEPVVPE